MLLSYGMSFCAPFQHPGTALFSDPILCHTSDFRTSYYDATTYHLASRLPTHSSSGSCASASSTTSSLVSSRQSSQIVSKSKSCLLSAPQTLHLLDLSLPIPLPDPLLPLPITPPASLPPFRLSLSLPDPLPPSSSSLSFFSLLNFLAILSASTAASSSSGLSGIVSKELIDGDRERRELGVVGLLDTLGGKLYPEKVSYLPAAVPWPAEAYNGLLPLPILLGLVGVVAPVPVL